MVRRASPEELRDFLCGPLRGAQTPEKKDDAIPAVPTLAVFLGDELKARKAVPGRTTTETESESESRGTSLAGTGGPSVTTRMAGDTASTGDVTDLTEATTLARQDASSGEEGRRPEPDVAIVRVAGSSQIQRGDGRIRSKAQRRREVRAEQRKQRASQGVKRSGRGLVTWPAQDGDIHDPRELMEPDEPARAGKDGKPGKPGKPGSAKAGQLGKVDELGDMGELSDDERGWLPAPLIRDRAKPLAWAASMLVHVMALGAGALWMASSATLSSPVASALPSLQRLVLTEEGELPVMLEPTHVRTPSVTRDTDAVAVASGGDEMARPDTQYAGKGGEREVTQLARFLAERDDGVTLDRDTLTHLERSQVARIKVAEDRASPEDRRALSEPMEVTFVAVGPGQTREQREHAARDPSRGVAAALEVSRAGGTKGASELNPGAGEKMRETGTDQTGAVASPGTGSLKAKPGQDHHAAADTSTSMPEASTGKDATLADTKSAARDNRSSEQDVATRDPALSHASTAGGEAGVGKGGEAGTKSTPGSGGTSGPGSQSPGAGKGGGAVVDAAEDPRRTDYIRRVMTKLRPLCMGAFPQSAALEGRGGLVIYTLTILADGSLGGLSKNRGSRIDEYDENIRRAILRAAPFDPLPAVLGPTQFALTIPFDALNPAVR